MKWKVFSLTLFFLLLPVLCISAVPVNPNASGPARFIYNYIIGLPLKNSERVISGQHCGQADTVAASSARIDAGYKALITTLADSISKSPALAGGDYFNWFGPITAPGTLEIVNTTLKEHWDNGGLITIMFSARNPWTGGLSNDTNTKGNLITDAITPGMSAYSAWISQLDVVASALKQLQDAGVVVLWRPLHEMNGRWFWWGSPANPKDFVAFWRHMYDYLVNTKGLNNLLWVYAPSAEAFSGAASVTTFYPGSDYVDIVGLDIYEDTLDAAVTAYNNLMALGKPFAITEFGPSNTTAVTKVYDYTLLIKEIKNKLPQTTYFMSWSDCTTCTPNYKYWSIVSNLNADLLLSDSWVVTTDDLPCVYEINPASASIAPEGSNTKVAISSLNNSCQWTAISNSSWINITSGSNNNGSGLVTYGVSQNNTGASRTGTITIGGHTLTVTQGSSVFTDVDPSSVYYNYITAIYQKGITVGCNQTPLMYCPTQEATRGQMAAFIIRAKYGEDFSYSLTPYFSDVPLNHTFFKYVQKLKDDGITTLDGVYNPEQIVTREQMAAFIIRAKYGEDFTYTMVPYFSDLSSISVFFKYIQRLKDESISTLVSAYDAGQNVTREQMAAFIARAFLDMLPTTPVSLTLVSRHKITPTTNDSNGAFSRIFYNPLNNRFYVAYAGRSIDSQDPKGMLRYFRWREYDADFNYTGVEGTLQGFTSAGDYAMLKIDNYYYHLTNYGSTNNGILSYKLTKLDQNMTQAGTVVFQLDPHDSNIDQLMNYTNNKLIIGAMHEDKYSPPTTPPKSDYVPYIHIYTYNLDLTFEGTNKVLSGPSNYSWGGSFIWDGANYNAVTFDGFNSNKLYVYRYDSGWDFVSQKLLADNAQWSQGLIWDGKYYYVSYHKGEHNHGNVSIGVFDAEWNLITEIQVTSNPFSAGLNAQRAFLTKVGKLLFVSYDLETYNPVTGENFKDWHAQVDVFEISP